MSLMISRKMVFCWVPRDLPAFNAPTTPWLSERIMICLPENFTVTSVQTASSTATISPHLISHPSEFHPSLNCHANHLPSITSPMPHPVDASTKSFVSDGSGGRIIFIPMKSPCKHHLHQSISSAANASETILERPSGTTKQTWFSMPITFSAAFTL
ncbi:hypothetical protein L208DRAFT_529490 [Tricholoma matsutake]|nr:hypothetical protein L208DRAFT_529490 [Tricholoma matsutake 945]